MHIGLNASPRTPTLIYSRRNHMVSNHKQKRKKKKKTVARKNTYLSKIRGLSPLLSDNFINIFAFGVDFLTAWKTFSPMT